MGEEQCKAKQLQHGRHFLSPATHNRTHAHSCTRYSHLQLLYREQRNAHSVELPQPFHKLSVAQLPPQRQPAIGCSSIAAACGGGAGVGGDAEQDAEGLGQGHETGGQLLE